MELTHDEIITYPGFTGRDSKAHLRIFQAGGQLPVVIIGQLDDNPSTSTTNLAEKIAEQIGRDYFPEGREFIYYEFYPGQINERHDDRTPTYSETTFDLTGDAGLGQPEWTFRRAEEVEALVGCPLPTWPMQGTYLASTATGHTPA